MKKLLSVLMLIGSISLCSGCFAQMNKEQTETALGGKPVVFEQQIMVRGALDRLIEAYQTRNLQNFMMNVSDDFTGDGSILESSVRKDFSSFNNISIRYTVNNLTFDGDGKKVYLSVSFTRSHQVIRTGKIENTSGTTEFVFTKAGDAFKLYSMKKPNLFGLSE